MTLEETIKQQVTAFGIQTGECIACGSNGVVILHVGRLGNKDYPLCEACTRRLWERRMIQA